jgi:glycosyltransferase involved in cell wall biosynthesis
MRIAVVHSFYSERQPSGENNVVVDQVAQLREAGHDVELLARKTDDISNNSLYPLASALRTLTGLSASPETALNHFKPDIVHLHNTFPNWGTNWLHKWGKRTVVTVHNYRTFCAAGTFFRDGHSCRDCMTVPVLPAVRHKCYRDSVLASVPLAWASSPLGPARNSLKQAARLITLNHEAQMFFSAVLRRSVEVVPNFVYSATHNLVPTKGWIFVGRLTPEKGLDRLLDFWPSEEPLDVIGAGPLLGRLRRQALARQKVKFLGPQPREHLLGSLGQYSGLIMPSMWTEGLPTVFLEALARGVPIVTSNHVAAAAALSRLGVAVQFDPTASEDSTRRALAAVRRGGVAMRARCVALHAQEYSPEVWRARIETIYAQVIASQYTTKERSEP